MDIDSMVYERTRLIGHASPSGLYLSVENNRMYFMDSIKAVLVYDHLYAEEDDFGVLAKFNRNGTNQKSLSLFGQVRCSVVMDFLCHRQVLSQ